MNIILFVFSIVFSCTLNAQIEVNSKGGSFEDLTPWGEGYLGIVQTQAYAVMPKYRQYQYFNESGEMLWNKKITPFNFNNASVCHSDSKFAYFVNMPFSKTALLEKSSKTELLNLYQVDQLGNVKEKAITYSGALRQMSGHSKKMEQCYLGAFKDGIIFVGKSNDENYHVVKIDHEFNVSYQNVDFEWNEKLWEKNAISKVKYVLGKDEVSLIQMKHKGVELVTVIKTIDLKTFSKVEEVINNVDFSGYTLNSKTGVDIDYSAAEKTFVSYERSDWKGDRLYIYATLGSFANYKYTNQGLKMYTYYKLIKPGTKKQIDKEGYLMYNMNNSEDTDVSPVSDFEFENDKSGSASHAFHVSNNGDFYFITKQSKSNITIKSSKGEQKKYDEKFSFAEVYLSFVTGTIRDKSDAVDVICFVGEKYIGIDFDGFKNSFGNSKKATVYRY